jgi:uncharacterized membrane protein YdbT with pleckstrin-like domain
MSYIDRNLLPDEQIVFRTKKHLIIFFSPVILTIFALFATDYMRANPLLSQIIWIPWVIVLIFWGYSWLEYATSEFAVTNKRVMMREGFFTRHSNEMRLTSISQVNVDQSLLGQMLNYGIVSINAFGAFDFYPLISQPNQFQKSVNEQLDRAVVK